MLQRRGTLPLNHEQKIERLHFYVSGMLYECFWNAAQNASGMLRAAPSLREF